MRRFAAVRAWWLSPPRSGVRRFIAPWEYRRLHAFAVTRFVGGCVAAAAGSICLAYGAYGWATFFLAVGALNLVAGYYDLALARTTSA